MAATATRKRLFNNDYFNQYLGGKDRIYEIVDGPNNRELRKMLKRGRVTFTVQRVLPENGRGEPEKEEMLVMSVSQFPDNPNFFELSHPIYVAKYDTVLKRGLFAVIM